MSRLGTLGWSDTRWGDALRASGPAGAVPARVVEQHRDRYRVEAETGEGAAEVAGRFRHKVVKETEWPTVGDWVVGRVSLGGLFVIDGVLPRMSLLVRQAVGGDSRGQPIAANVDTVFIVSSPNQDWNERRLERMLTIVWDSGAKPVILVNKCDLAANVGELIAGVETIARGAPVFRVSARTGEGIADIERFVLPGTTIAFLGTSGVGKSSLINRLAGEEILAVREIRAWDDRGRHTTTSRQLVQLPRGGLVIDTPGVRLIGLGGQHDEGLATAFDDVTELAGACRFRDCRHEGEPGCAVREAVDTGELDAGRLRNFNRLQREQAYEARREDRRARAQEWKRQRVRSRAIRRLYQSRDGEGKGRSSGVPSRRQAPACIQSRLGAWRGRRGRRKPHARLLSAPGSHRAVLRR